MASIDYQEARKEIVRLFQENEGNGRKIIFWYDPPVNFKEDIAADSFDCCKVLVCDKNEFAIKKTLEHDDTASNYLIYFPHEKPADKENWLLDVLLAHGQFSTDQVAMLLTEMELGPEFADVVQEHLEFFRAAKRKEALRKLMEPDDTKGRLRLKMLAVCAASDVRMDSVVECLLQELAAGGDDKFRLVSRCGLESFFWNQMQR